MKKIPVIIGSFFLIIFSLTNIADAILAGRDMTLEERELRSMPSNLFMVFIGLTCGTIFTFIWLYVKNWISKSEGRKKFFYKFFLLFLLSTILITLVRIFVLPVIIKNNNYIELYQTLIDRYFFGILFLFALLIFFAIIPSALISLIFSKFQDENRKKLATNSFNLMIIPGFILGIMVTVALIWSIISLFLNTYF